MSASLAAVVADLESASHRVQALSAACSHEIWTARPAPGCWSPAECVAHLNLSARVLLPCLEDGVRRAGAIGRARHGRYRRDLVGWLLWHAVRPGGWVKLHATAACDPAQAAYGEAAGEFAGLQARTIQCVRDAEGLALERIAVVSPFDARVRCNLYSAFTLVPRHQHRHLRQAEQAVRQSAARVRVLPACAG